MWKRLLTGQQISQMFLKTAQSNTRHEAGQSSLTGASTPPARGMAKQLPPTAGPAAGPQHVRADSKRPAPTSGSSCGFDEVLAVERKTIILSRATTMLAHTNAGSENAKARRCFLQPCGFRPQTSADKRPRGDAVSLSLSLRSHLLFRLLSFRSFGLFPKDKP